MNTQTSSLQSLLLAKLTEAAKPQDLALVCCPPPGACVPAVAAAPIPTTITASPPESRLLQGRPRTGAVASLPKDKRDLVCRLIGRGVPYKKIAQAIEQLGFLITERNLSNWVTHGGYAEWCALYQDALQTSLRQDALLQYHRSDNSPDLAEVGLQAGAARLSELILREAQSPGTDGNVSKLEPLVTILCRINKELLNNQKHRDDYQTKAYRNPARVQAKAHDKLAEVEAEYSAAAPHKLIDTECSPADPPAAANPAQPSSPAPASEAIPPQEPRTPVAATTIPPNPQAQPATGSSPAQPSDQTPTKPKPEPTTDTVAR